MSHREPPLVSRVVGGVRDAVGGVGTLLRGDDGHESATDVLGGADRSATGRDGGRDTSATALVDPDDGPTSRGEVIERGYSPAEYVRAVVVVHDGTVKQRQFADEYGWSAATISRLLSDLEDRGVIERYRLGREKIVCLPTE